MAGGQAQNPPKVNPGLFWGADVASAPHRLPSKQGEGSIDLSFDRVSLQLMSISRRRLTQCSAIHSDLSSDFVEFLQVLLVEWSTCHSGTESAVKCEGVASSFFPVNTGLRQGSILAPSLFNTYMDFL